MILDGELEDPQSTAVPHYVSSQLSKSGWYMTTTTTKSALRVWFDPLRDPHRLRILVRLSSATFKRVLNQTLKRRGLPDRSHGLVYTGIGITELSKCLRDSTSMVDTFYLLVIILPF